MTEARRSRSEDIAYRERRYLVMMALRMACFVIAVVLFFHGAGWIAAIPAVGAIFIPYVAVVAANAGRGPAQPRGFRPYEPNFPALYSSDQDTPEAPNDSRRPGGGRDASGPDAP